MIIERLHIRNFGKLHNIDVDLAPGMNLVYGENEAGKSTLHSFVHGMFFGVQRLRGKGARKDTYSRYQPWSNPAEYLGEMDFSCGSRHFRLSRNFQKNVQDARLVCLDDEEHMSLEHGDLDMLLGGIHEGIYDNTVSVGQLKSVTGRELASELENYIANFQSGADEDMNLQSAREQLRGKLKEQKRLKEEQAASVDGAMRQLQGKIELLEQEQQDCQRKREQLQEQIRKMEAEQKAPRERAAEQKRADKPLDVGGRYVLFAAGWGLLAVLAVILALLFREGTVFYVCLLLAIIAGIQVPVNLFVRKDLAHKLREPAVRNVEGADVTGVSGELEDSDIGKVSWDEESCRKAKWQVSQLQDAWQERAMLLDNFRQDVLDLEDSRHERNAMDEEMDALQLAITHLDQTIEKMQGGIGSRLCLRMGEILSELTDGKYTSIVIGQDMDIQVQTIDRMIALHQFSRGTLEQIYFALRMAASEILCGEEEMPVILDDVFAMYDEQRLARALKWLARYKKQVILLTCHRREREILDRVGIHYHFIDMSQM